MQTAVNCSIEVNHRVPLRAVRYDLLCPNEQASAEKLQSMLFGAYKNTISSLHPGADLKLTVEVQPSGGRFAPIQANASTSNVDLKKLSQALAEAFDRVKSNHKTWML